MLGFYEATDDVQAVVSSGLTFKGKGGIRRMFQTGFSEASWHNVQLPQLTVHQEGNVTWATCRFEAEIRIKPAGDKFRFTSQGIYVLRRTNGVWKIASEHFSPIHGVERLKPLNSDEQNR
jgi:ketosteroid isomerase-like protein